MNTILSRQNEKIKYAVKLRDNSSFRAEQNCFIIEGARLCADAFLSGATPVTVFVTDIALKKYSEYITPVTASGAETFIISDEVSVKLSDTKNPQGVFCIFKMLDKNAFIGKINYNGKYVALDNISNPANFGAICRTAEAVGLDGVITSGGCDIYNPKAQRASMGALFRLSVITTDSICELFGSLILNGMRVYSSVTDTSAQKITEADMSGGVICVIGNEGNGVSAEVRKASSALVTIPMKGRAESLNAAEAASIIMWEMMR